MIDILYGCHFEPEKIESRCGHFVSIFEAMDALEKGESDFLKAIPEIREVIATLREFPEWRVPFYTRPNAFGICLNREILRGRGEMVELRITMVEEGTADDLKKVLESSDDQVGRGSVKVLQEIDNQGRPLRRIIVDHGGQVTALEKRQFVEFPDIGCYHPSQEIFDQPQR